MGELLLRIGDVAEATGLTQRAIRYYEEYGLLEPASHPSGANRRYEQDDLERLQLIKRLREDVGLSLAEIRTYLEVEDVRRVLKTEYDAAVDPADAAGGARSRRDRGAPARGDARTQAGAGRAACAPKTRRGSSASPRCAASTCARQRGASLHAGA